ncbi:MDR family MFS transporter [Canibacter zhoujuaniae]|uniref:MDR family MFS transporter n=1 Tax=Canibacter zhoujuaniae TaxID=2708343 RepID=UPI00141EDD78|nr:MDR family MFS transporter [Canibacter zhoujuaniae]
MRRENEQQESAQSQAEWQSPTTLGRDDNFAIWVLIVTGFVLILNETLMNVALPVLMAEMHVEASTGQWLTAGFLLTMSVVIPITGTLIQRMQTRTLYFTAVGFFTLGTLLAAIAPGFAVLLAGRVIQAVGTAIIMPLMMTTVMTLVPTDMRGKVMGRISMVISLAPALGPTISGLVIQFFNWRVLFIMVLPIVIGAGIFAHLKLRNVGYKMYRKIDLLSVLLTVPGFGLTVYGLSTIGEGAAHGGGLNTQAFVIIAVGLVCLALFVWRQSTLAESNRALLDLRVFKFRPFWIGSILMALSMAAMFGTFMLLPLYAANVLDWDTLHVGLVLLPGSLLMAGLGQPVGRLVDLFGARLVMIPGVVLNSVALWLATLFNESTQTWFVLLAQVTLSLGLAFTFTPLFSTLMGSLPPHLTAHGSAVVSTLQQVAGAAGTAIFVMIFSATSAALAASGAAEITAYTAGVHQAYLVAAILITAAAPIVALIPGKSSGDSTAQMPH